jgi:hypothetical protein
MYSPAGFTTRVATLAKSLLCATDQMGSSPSSLRTALRMRQATS